MRKALIALILIVFCCISLKCSEPGIFFPEKNLELVYPSDGLICINNEIDFNWTDKASSQATSNEYTIIIARDRQLQDIVSNTTTTFTNFSLALDKLEGYYWSVTSDKGDTTPVFSFYTQGDAITNYAPFRSDLKAPENNAIVSNGNINLIWEASDANASDTLIYEVFFGENTTLNLIESGLTDKQHTVNVLSGKIYSWRVNVIDNFGAKSIGEVFTFSVN